MATHPQWHYIRRYRLLRSATVSYYDLIGCAPDCDEQQLKNRLGEILWIINISNGSDDTVLLKQWSDYNKLRDVLIKRREEYDELHQFAVRSKNHWIVRLSTIIQLIFIKAYLTLY